MSALWLLLRFQLIGWLRYLARGLRTVKGALTALVGLMVFAPWLVAMLLTPGTGGTIEPGDLARFGPGGVLLYCVLNLVFSPSDRSIYFSPAEIQFLFTGPFGRRQVLAYKLVLTLLVSLPAAFIMVVVIRVRGGWFPAVLLGALLVSCFLQLFTLFLGLIGSVLGVHFFSRGRWVVVAGAIALLALVLAQAASVAGAWSPSLLWREALDTGIWQTITRPVQSFFDMMRANTLGDLAVPCAIAVLLNLGLLVAIFALDAQFLEASAAASARFYARVLRLRGKQVEPTSAEKGGGPRWGLPMPPYWGGIGPIFWRQLTAGLRNVGRLFLLLFIACAASAAPAIASAAAKATQSPQSLLPMIVGMGFWLGIFLTALVPFDFRGDIDRMGALKALPIPAWRLALGQVLTPVVVLSLMQWAIVAGGLIVAPEYLLAGLIVAAYVPVFNFALIGLDNLLFLLFPVRLMASTPGDFQAVGRNVLLMVGKLVGLGVFATAAGGTAAVVGLVTRNWYVGALAGLPVLLLGGMVLVPLMALAFQWFDVSRDTPA